MEGGQIIQEALNKTIKFNNTKVYAPCGLGFSFFIEPSDNAYFTNLLVYNSRFEDFVELFHIKYPGTIDIFNNEFIRVEFLIGSVDGHVLHLIGYDTEDPSQSNFRFQGNYLNAGSGIWLDGVYGVTLSANTFEDCEHAGVFLIGGTGKISIESSTFRNCTAGLEYDGNFNSTSDYLIANKNRFENVETAFDIRAENLTANENRFENVETAFDIKAENIYLVGNEMTNDNIAGGKFLVSTGADMGSMLNSLSLEANNNILRNVETAFDVPFIDNIFLNANELINDNIAGDKFLVSTGGNSFILSNIIDDSHLGNVKTAFSLQGGGKVIAHFNNYNATPGAYMFNVSGKDYMDGSFNISNGGRIYLKGINELDFNSNEVDARYMKFAFRTDMSNGTYCKNKGRNANRVFSFRGNCMNTDFKNNEIGVPWTITTGTGFYVDDVIGQQEHKANLWYSGYSVEGATNSSTDPILSLMTVNSDPSQGGNSLFIPQNNSYSPVIWFDPDNSITSFADCQTSNIANPGDPSNHITMVDKEVVRGTYNTTPLSNWMAIRNVIRKLIEHPSLLNDAEVNTWYQAQQNLGVYTVAAIEYELSDYYGTDDEVEDIRILLDDYVSFTDALSQLNIGDSGYQDLVDAIEQIKNDLTVIQSSINSSKSIIQSNVNNMLSSLVATNDYESLFEDVYLIYIKYLQDIEYVLTTNEVDIINEAANLCPLMYGSSIYTARLIATKYKILFDEDNCSGIRTRNSKSGEEASNDLIVYPNPATNIVNVRSSQDINNLRVYDTNMNLILSKDETILDVSSLPSGIYILEAYGNTSLIGRQKVVVIK